VSEEKSCSLLTTIDYLPTFARIQSTAAATINASRKARRLFLIIQIIKPGTSPAGKAPGSGQAFYGHGTMRIKDRLEVFVEIFDGDGTSFMKHFTHLHPVILMGIGVAFASMRSYQNASLLYDKRNRASS
jgi:hypothetical protein